jgi:hypothetical protein
MNTQLFSTEVKDFGASLLAKISTETRSKGSSHTSSSTSRYNLNSKQGRNHLENLQLRLPSLSELIIEYSPLPAYSVLLGACEDQLPVLLDLTNPEPGAVLLVGDPGSGKIKFLDTLLKSACALNPPRRLRFCKISTDQNNLNGLSVYPHCYRLAAVYEKEAVNIIQELVETADHRHITGSLSSSIVLFIDDLASLVKNLDEEETNMLLWLVQNGAAARIWVFAALNPRMSAVVKPSLLNSFSTWLLGYTDPLQSGPCIPHEILQASQELIPGAQFSAYFEQSWVPFWIPAA